MRRILCVLLCLLLPSLALAEEQGYLGDGWCMLTVTTETSCLRAPGDTAPQLTLPEGTRAIVCREMLQTSGTGAVWYRVYLPDAGYGWVSGDHVQLDEPRLLTYQPGFGVSVALFTVDDPASYRVEVASLDELEYPVVTWERIMSRQQEDGGYLLIAVFSTASDVCKTLKENLCATLYGPDGQPLEVLTLTFDAPTWRR